MFSVVRAGLARLPLHRGMALSAQQLDPVQEALLAEPCILVDQQDRALGVASKRECHTVDQSSGSSPLHRAFSLFVFNDNKELLLQQRSHTKAARELWHTDLNHV